MANTHNPLKNQNRVLVLDGGGFRGLGTLLVIDSITKAASSRTRKALLPCQIFDLICGSSIGGLIAILLGRLHLDCSTAIQIYKNLAVSVCGTDESTFMEKLLTSDDSGLDSKPFERAFLEILRKYTGLEDTPMADEDIINRGVANTFVTVASDAPNYDNRIYCIRSYLSPIRPPPPTTHKWLIREAARATVAPRIFMSPLFVSKYGYRDAAFAGFSSPVNLMSREVEKLWSYDQVNVIASIGIGLASLIPSNARREWGATDKYVKPFVEKVIHKLPPSSRPSELASLNATYIIKQLMTLAVDTEVSQAEIVQRIPSSCKHVRINPPPIIEDTDLVDCFRFDAIEDQVRLWLQGEGKKYISDVANSLVELNVEPLTVEQGSLILPPSPPPNTNPGYNPQLDERRPDTVTEYLKNYHVYFVIDDSGSMEGDRWSETGDALLEIAEHALEQKADVIDLMFFNNPLSHHGVKGSQKIRDIFAQVIPDGPTPTGATLQRILDKHIEKLDKAVNTTEYGKIRPLDIIVLSDGVPTDEPKDVLVEAVARLKTAKHHPNAVGVQMVQIGDDPGAAPALKALMGGDVGSIVDAVPYNGKLNPQKLERILLGGLHPNVRSLLSAA